MSTIVTTIDPERQMLGEVEMVGRARWRSTTSSPAGPTQNAYIERFNRTYRPEVLNAHLFESIAELRARTDTWLRLYNEERPHDSLGRVPPLTFLPRPTTARKSTYALST